MRKMGELTISPGVFNTTLKIREELDRIIETIEIMNDKELMEGLRGSMEDVKAGRVYELKDIGDDAKTRDIKLVKEAQS